MSNCQSHDLKSLTSTLCVSGKDSVNFLNGMLTQDFKLAYENTPSCGRAWILTNKAKIIAPINFFTIRIESNSSTLVILAMPENEKEKVRIALEKYIVADDVQILDTASDQIDLKICVDVLEKIAPRHPLGREELFKVRREGNALVLSKGDYFWDKARTFAEAFDEGRPRWGREILSDDFFLEFPLAADVSFDKGCYIGQETVARGTFRGKVNKSFARITSQTDIPLGEILDSEGNTAGTIRSSENGRALGIIKFNVEIPNAKIDWLVNEKTFRGER